MFFPHAKQVCGVSVALQMRTSHIKKSCEGGLWRTVGKKLESERGEGRTGFKLRSCLHQIRVIEPRNGPLIRTDDHAYFCSHTSVDGRYGTCVVRDRPHVLK